MKFIGETMSRKLIACIDSNVDRKGTIMDLPVLDPPLAVNGEIRSCVARIFSDAYALCLFTPRLKILFSNVIISKIMHIPPYRIV